MITIKKLIPFLLILLLLIVVKNNVVFILDYLHKGSALGNLEKNLTAEQKKNQFLKERLYYVKTDQFVADEAQNKLGMLKPGEFFVIAPTGTPLRNLELNPDSKPNWQKWLDLFL